MPKIKLLPLSDYDKKTPGFTHECITKAKNEGTVIETIRESVEEGHPCWRIIVPGYGYEWYVYKSETVLVKKPTILITED